ncbi:LysR family transcriptional regulator [Seohaeicola zhoushanensis]
MNISLRQLEYLLAAARAGSVSGAARSMNVSSSSIFMAIDKFEEEFAIQVFVRQRASGLMLTTEGKRAIERTIRLLDEYGRSRAI